MSEIHYFYFITKLYLFELFKIDAYYNNNDLHIFIYLLSLVNNICI